MMPRFLVLSFACFLTLSACEQPAPSVQPAPSIQPTEAELTVRKLSEAFNQHDAALLASLVHENVTWLSLAADSAVIEAEGRTALEEGMGSYFEALPSVRSEIEDLVVTGPFVAFRERVFWQGEAGEKTQASLAVYEVRDAHIRRAWYFPSID